MQSIFSLSALPRAEALPGAGSDGGHVLTQEAMGHVAASLLQWSWQWDALFPCLASHCCCHSRVGFLSPGGGVSGLLYSNRVTPLMG